MKFFEQRLSLLGKIPGPRRAKDGLYELRCVILCSSFAITSDVIPLGVCAPSRREYRARRPERTVAFDGRS
jgi:hypothetical protein